MVIPICHNMHVIIIITVIIPTTVVIIIIIVISVFARVFNMFYNCYY